MPEEASQDGRFEPLHDAHAIERVALGLHFESGLDESRMRSIRQSSESFKAKLPGVADLQTITFAMGAFPAGALPGPKPAVGRAFTHTRPDGTVETELRLEANAVSYQTTAYTRWTKVWEDAWGFMSVVLPTYLSGCRLAALSLNYIDKFHWVEGTGEFQPSALLRVGSPYISPHIFGAKDLWHSHTGAFIRASQRTKRLMNLNLDCVDQQGPDGTPRRVIQITTALTDILNQPGYEPTTDISPETALAFTQNVFNDQHRFSKELFAEVINDQMGERIAIHDVEPK